MTAIERTEEETAAAEVMRLTLRLREQGAALRNQQESFNDMLEKLQQREQEAVFLASERAARTAAEASASRLRFLAEASAVLSSSLNSDATLATVTRLVVPVMADFAAVDLLEQSGTSRRLSTHHRDASKMEVVRRLQERFPDRPDAAFGVPKALRTRSADVGFDVPESLLASVAQNEEHLRLLRSLDLKSYIVVPLIAHDELLGALTVAYAESDRRYTPDDVALIQDLARRAATAIQNARLVRGLEQARQRLQEQTDELEAQTEELQQTAQELEINSEELRNANETLAATIEEAQSARLAAEAANAAKAEFLSTMSHELRTPLNAIAGYGELLSMGVHGSLNDAQREALERIRRSQQRLLSMINDVLNFAKLEAGKIEMDMQDVQVAAVFANLDVVMQSQMQLKGLKCRFDPCEGDVHVRADREKMEQVLLNLLSNALKFTESTGSVRVNCSADATSVDLQVSDTGRGIPADRLHSVFDPFVQIDPKRTVGTEGVGLGLAISRDLARAMGGELRVESTVDVGTTFTFRLVRAR